MKPAFITANLLALGALLGAATQVIPLIGGVLAAIYYGFLVYDRIRYGPTLRP